MNIKIAAFFLIFSAWAIIFVSIPPFHSPDEPSHYENVLRLTKGYYPYQIVDKTKKNVLYVTPLEKLYYSTPFNAQAIAQSSLWRKYTYSREEEAHISPENLHAYHPFLYYTLLVPSQWIASLLKTNLVDRFYITRLFNSLFFFMCLFVFYKMVQMLVTDRKKRLVILLFFGLNPLVIKSFIGINPDNGVAFFSLLFLLVLLHTKKMTFFSGAKLGFLAGCCVISKLTGIATFLVLLYSLVFAQEKGKQKIFQALFTGLVFAVTVSPWFLFTYFRYHSFQTATGVNIVAWGGPLQPHSIISSLFLGVVELRHTFMHFAGFYGSQNNIYPPRWFLIGYTFVFFCLFLLGMFKTFFSPRKIKSLFVMHKKIGIYVISFLIFLSMLGFYNFRSGALWDTQGRYALAVFPIFCYLVMQSTSFVLPFFIFSIIHFTYSIVLVYLPTLSTGVFSWRTLNLIHPLFGYIFVWGGIVFIFSSILFIYLYRKNEK